MPASDVTSKDRARYADARARGQARAQDPSAVVVERGYSTVSGDDATGDNTGLPANRTNRANTTVRDRTFLNFRHCHLCHISPLTVCMHGFRHVRLDPL